jgi:cytochrome P450
MDPVSGGCPVRKLTPPGEATAGPDVERVIGPDGERVVIRSFALARQVLRDEDGYRQAGFGADTVQAQGTMRPPILYLDGQDHRTQRRASAPFFTPKAIEAYRPMMDELAERLVAEVRPDRSVDLADLAMRMAVEVVGRVVGLSHSSLPGMTKRLNTFFDGDPLSRTFSVRALPRLLRTHSATFRFYWQDVKPAIRAHRRHPQDDLISAILEQGFSDLEILTESITYGAAGMVTTRELISVGAWHLLEDPGLLARFREGDRDSRSALLQETLRLEPVVGRLLRRAGRAVRLEGRDSAVDVAEGDLVDIDVRAANADAEVAGTEPLQLCPERELPRGVPAAVMGFGDGHHKCPGGPIAIMEAEIFLTALFRRDIVADGPPRVRWNPVSQGYDLDRFMLRVASSESRTVRPPSAAVPGA